MKKLMAALMLGMAFVSLEAKEFRIPIQNKNSYSITITKMCEEENLGVETNCPLKIKPGETKIFIVNLPQSYIDSRGTELLALYANTPTGLLFSVDKKDIDCRTVRKVILTETRNGAPGTRVLEK